MPEAEPSTGGLARPSSGGLEGGARGFRKRTFSRAADGSLWASGLRPGGRVRGGHGSSEFLAPRPPWAVRLGPHPVSGSSPVSAIGRFPENPGCHSGGTVLVSALTRRLLRGRLLTLHVSAASASGWVPALHLPRGLQPLLLRSALESLPGPPLPAAPPAPPPTHCSRERSSTPETRPTGPPPSASSPPLARCWDSVWTRVGP